MKLCVFAILLLLTGCANAQPPFRDSALTLDLERGTCSGTAVAPNVILTASHCLEEGNRIKAINGKPAYALKAIHDGKDHVLVRVSIKFKRWSRVGGDLLMGDRVRWIGSPAANPGVYREGYVTRSNKDEVWLDAQAFGGDSGSGVHCSDGRLCGVISAGKVWVRGPHVFTMTVVFPMAFTAEDWKAIA